jgi:hypothetical protein
MASLSRPWKLLIRTLNEQKNGIFKCMNTLKMEAVRSSETFVTRPQDYMAAQPGTSPPT